VDKNKLSSLPPSIESLTKLKRLDMSENQFGAFPTKLPSSLDALVCRSCGAKKLPESGWSTYPHLLELDVSGNGLTELPEAISECKKLRILRAANNKLPGVPMVILQATVVDNVSLKGNLFDEKQFKTMDGVAEYLVRRKARLDKSLSNSVNLEGFNDVM